MMERLGKMLAYVPPDGRDSDDIDSYEQRVAAIETKLELLMLRVEVLEHEAGHDSGSRDHA